MSNLGTEIIGRGNSLFVTSMICKQNKAGSKWLISLPCISLQCKAHSYQVKDAKIQMKIT